MAEDRDLFHFLSSDERDLVIRREHCEDSPVFRQELIDTPNGPD